MICPRCQSTEHYILQGRKTVRCKQCSRDFSETSGTVWKSSKLGPRERQAVIDRLDQGENRYSISVATGLQYKTVCLIAERRKAEQHVAEPVFEPTAQAEADEPGQITISEIIEALSWVGARGNEGPLGPGGWRVTDSGRIQIHCRCGTEFLASEETGMGNGRVGRCTGCKKKIHASSYWELWTTGRADRPIQWRSGVYNRQGTKLC
ncbi:MAG: Transposase [Bradyrhizobium sp.]|nr:Transposase [Bradyrhizobium sp.]